MPHLTVVCLISGGKDSLFSILHCLKNGHEVVALANLHPPVHDGEDAVEDMDSYMYQTVGHAVIPLYEEALGLPLYRQEIKGAAVNQDKCYGPDSDKDETEALMPLLRKVIAHHPEVNAVSTGAILSDYQRTRVESVAIRLGLTPLSYLWQWPNLLPHSQDSLLHDMAKVGQDARIIKVASGGLDESVLWQNVADAKTIGRLNRAVQRFGSSDDGAVLGEGGEYETLALSGPRPLWKGHIKVSDEDRGIVSGEAGSYSVKIKKAQVERKADSSHITTLRQPPLLEPRFQNIMEGLHDNFSVESLDHDYTAGGSDASLLEFSTSGKTAGQILLADLVGLGVTAATQMRAIMEEVANTLRKAGHSLRYVAYTSIILRNMEDFASVNTVYGSFFVHPNPPARATLACANVLPEGKHVMVAMTSVADDRSTSRKGLHVQSRSYWAPANIGPYSQAISVPAGDGAAHVYVAGQIPLIPASMGLTSAGDIERSFKSETVLSLQHLDRIGRVMCVRQWAGAMVFVTGSPQHSAATRSEYARQAWTAYHRSSNTKADTIDSDTEDESFDVWHAEFGAQRNFARPGAALSHTKSPGFEETVRLPALQVVVVDALPRSASIEWVAIGLTDDRDVYVVPHMQHLLQLFKANGA